MIKVSGIYPPAIAKIGNKTYAVPSWTELPENTTLDMLEWIRPERPVYTEQEHQVGSYVVKVSSSGNITCTCPGYTYRRTCKHRNSFLQVT